MPKLPFEPQKIVTKHNDRFFFVFAIALFGIGFMNFTYKHTKILGQTLHDQKMHEIDQELNQISVDPAIKEQMKKVYGIKP